MNFSRCTLSANSGSSLAAKQNSCWSSGCVSKLAQNSQGNLLFISLHFQPTPSCFTSYAVWLLLCPLKLPPSSSVPPSVQPSLCPSVGPSVPACLPAFLQDPPCQRSSLTLPILFRPSVRPPIFPSLSFLLPPLQRSPNVARFSSRRNVP